MRSHQRFELPLLVVEVLLVVDNLEQVVGAAPDIAQLVEACPRLRLLVTSRERLRLQAEWLLPLEGLNVPPEKRLRTFAKRMPAAVITTPKPLRK